MAKYEITSPQGEKYEITAPDSASQDEVLAYAKQKFSGGGSAPPPAHDTRKTSQTLGAAKGAAETVDNFWRNVESLPGAKGVMDSIGRASPVFALARDAERALVHDKAIPAIEEAEKTAKPGGIGEFIGKTAVSLPSYAAGGLLGGGVQGFAESHADGDMGRLAMDTATGSAFGKAGDVVGGAITKKVGEVAGGLARRAAAKAKIDPAKVVKSLQTAKDNAYTAMRGMGIRYTVPALERLQGDLNKTLAEFGANAADHGEAFNFLEGVAKDFDAGRHGMDALDKIRSRVYRDVANLSNPDKAATAKLGGDLGRVITDFMENTAASDLAMGSGASDAARTALNEKGKLALEAARVANKKFKNVERVNDLMRSSELKAGATYQGLNIDNRTRQSLRPLLDPTSGKNIEHFLSPDEAAQLEKTVVGTPGHNALRLYGQTSPLAGGLTAVTNATGSVGAGLAAGGAGGFVAAGHLLASSIAKLQANAITKKNVRDLVELMASGGTKEAMLAERQLRAMAAKNPYIGSWLETTLKDAAEIGTSAGVRGQADARQPSGVSVEIDGRPETRRDIQYDEQGQWQAR